VLSLEDPVEYTIPGVSQSQVRPEIGYTFANGLRTTLRQDPNIIMVGEIRDSETANLAVQAALTGHLVLSTIHTNNSVGIVPRLLTWVSSPTLYRRCLSWAWRSAWCDAVPGRRQKSKGRRQHAKRCSRKSLPTCRRV
jgi:type II secretory ATPase GspE/PulE/Tfp pilus assembly ATPase PilB-like protein